MAKTSLTRRITFAAAHRYRRPDWTDARNLEAFGLCSRPNYHGHSYTCDITVSADVDAETGFVVNLHDLDAILNREVKQRFDHANINLDVPEFADGKLIPTGENLAKFIFERVQMELGHHAQVESVRVAEDDTLSIRYER